MLIKEVMGSDTLSIVRRNKSVGAMDFTHFARLPTIITSHFKPKEFYISSTTTGKFHWV